MAEGSAGNKTSREETPEGPGAPDDSAMDDPGADAKHSAARTKNKEGREGDPLEGEGKSIPVSSLEADPWGDLPERVRQVFREQSTEYTPPRYRDWIDAYYRRLNRDR